MNRYFFVTVPFGAENVVRSSITARPEGHRSAFARPGLLTFKSSAEISASDPRPHPLAATWGLSLGPASTTDEITTLLARLSERPCLAVYPGEPGPRGHVPDGVLERWALAADGVRDEIARFCGDRLFLRAPSLGEPVLDVVVREGEPWFVGWHRHIAERGPLPGGLYPIGEPPEQTPSRAWRKLEELVAWSGAPLKAGELALELGCAPGGATVALLDRGLRVDGVDPQEMALPERLSAAPFVHHKAPIEAIPRDDLPDGVAWIIVDLSVAAPVALRALQRLVKRYRSSSLRGVLLTLKLNEWSLAEQQEKFRARLAEMGLVPIGPAYMPSMRQELGMAAFVEGRSRSR